MPDSRRPELVLVSKLGLIMHSTDIRQPNAPQRPHSHGRKQTTTLAWLRRFISNIGLLLVPLPLGPLRSKLVGRFNTDSGVEFYSHPPFILTCHLIWLGWLVTLLGLYNLAAISNAWWIIPMDLFNWLWVLAVLCTIIVLGLEFNRVACGFLAAGVVIAGLLGMILEAQVHFPLSETFYKIASEIPVVIEWGVPLMVSLVLGALFTGVATCQRLNDRWRLPSVGNYIEHLNFQH